MNSSTDNITLAEVPYTPPGAVASVDATRAPTPVNDDELQNKTALSESDLADQTLYLPPTKVRIIVATLALAFFLAVLE